MAVEAETGGELYVVGTPIGNLGDITLRALETLETVDRIAAEDTRQTIKLLNHFGIEKPVTSYFEHNKTVKGPALIQELRQGKKIALVSDAGMPGISDPGADLIKECIACGVRVTVIPGPSALIAALVGSGLDTAGFLYAGFFPRGEKARRQVLEGLGQESRTLVFYESPHRLREALTVLREVWGERQCCVAREITKIYEEFVRGTISDVLSIFQAKDVKGEITLLVEGKKPGIQAAESIPWDEIETGFNQLVAGGMSKKEALKEMVQTFGVSKRELYNRVMVERKKNKG